MDRNDNKGQSSLELPITTPDKVFAFFRWHQDIHPRNILVQSNGDSRESPFEYNFKLGDFGISHFKSRGASWRQATDIDTSGTLTYGRFLFLGRPI